MYPIVFCSFLMILLILNAIKHFDHYVHVFDIVRTDVRHYVRIIDVRTSGQP
jgi:hypothetical protein